MVYLEKYNPEKIYYFQDGRIANYDAIQDIFPLIDEISCIVFTDYNQKIIISLRPLDLVRTDYNIDTSLSEEDAILAIAEKINHPDAEVRDETRIADALEDLVVLNMPDEEVE